MEELFNSVIKENTGRAVHEQHPIVWEQIRNKWKRIIESLPSHTGPTEQASSSFCNSGDFGNNNYSQPAQNSFRGRGGTTVRGRGNRGGARGGPRSGFQIPQVNLEI